jgi:hypothetical protein
MIKKIFNFLKKKNKKNHFDNDALMLSIGQIQSRLNLSLKSMNINNYEFKSFSQWGEDGIINYLVSNLKIENKTFIEFGVENYEEANTKFLLLNKNWTGFILDSLEDNINQIKNSDLYWKYSLQAICKFVTKENINDILKLSNFKKNVGILSIDIDGNDYWIWKEINVIDPSIVIIEYNARLGKEKTYVVPYEKNFQREKKHYSMIYYGASIQALIKLAKEKGYAFICCNKAGNNAFFVKKKLLNEKVKENNIEEGFFENNFRESRNENGELIYLDKKSEEEIIFKLPLIEV